MIIPRRTNRSRPKSQSKNRAQQQRRALARKPIRGTARSRRRKLWAKYGGRNVSTFPAFEISIRANK